MEIKVCRNIDLLGTQPYRFTFCTKKMVRLNLDFSLSTYDLAHMRDIRHANMSFQIPCCYLANAVNTWAVGMLSMRALDHDVLH